MPRLRVIWIRWQEGSCDCDLFERSRQWQTARPEKNYQIVSWAPNATSGVLANVCTGENYIYLRGHGVPGDPTVNPTNTFNNPNGISIYESIDRMGQMGLKPGFRGMIKCYSCFSGLSGVDRTRTIRTAGRKHGFFGERVLKEKKVQLPRPEGTWDPLAQRGASYMRGIGFDFCSFWVTWACVRAKWKTRVRTTARRIGMSSRWW